MELYRSEPHYCDEFLFEFESGSAGEWHGAGGTNTTSPLQRNAPAPLIFPENIFTVPESAFEISTYCYLSLQAIEDITKLGLKRKAFSNTKPGNQWIKGDFETTSSCQLGSLLAASEDVRLVEGGGGDLMPKIPPLFGLFTYFSHF
ncbi:hypothetical protein J6590_022631 [Homalodisca vitripennis]|nr:hypothetical protein J6590_022631 [Homalodisca vitripennis]